MKKNKNILKYAEAEARKGKSLAVGGTGMKITKVAYIIAAVYSIFMCMVVMFGNLFKMMEYAEKSTTSMVDAYNQERMYFITLCIAIAVTIVAMVLMKLKFSIPFGILGCVNCVIVFTVFLKASLENDIKNGGQLGFWGPFGIPSILCAALAVFIMILHLLDARRVDEKYTLITTKLYEKATENGEKNIDYDEFDKILDDYRGEEVFTNEKPLKKSQRRRKAKQEEALAELKAAEEKDADDEEE